MESKSQAADAARQTGDPNAREPVEPRQQTFVTQATARDSRVAEPAVATDGQLVEAGYGHGV
jgi:hypothetical protein